MKFLLSLYKKDDSVMYVGLGWAGLGRRINHRKTR